MENPSTREAASADLDRERARFFALSLDLLCVAGFDGFFKDINPAWEATLGYSRAELLAEPFLSFVHPDDRPATAAETAKLIEGHVTLTFENRYRAKDGRYRSLLWTAYPVPAERRIYASARDHTEQRRLERRIAAQYAVTAVLATDAELKDATPTILRLIAESMGWELGAIWQIDATDKALHYVDGWQTPGLIAAEFEASSRTTTFPMGIGLPGRVWQTERAAWITDVAQDANFPRIRAAVRTGLHAAFAFPIVLAGSVIGVFEFFSRETRVPDPPVLDMMTSLGSQIGQFTGRKISERERERLIGELREALVSVKTLRGLLPICAVCNKIRDERGDWNRLEAYLERRTDVNFTHGLCAECARREHPDWDSTP